MNNFKKVR